MRKRVWVDSRVVVEVRPPWIPRKGQEEVQHKNACDEVVASVRRHVDNVLSVARSDEYASVCEFCASPWTEDSATYNGGCCDRDESNNPSPEAP